MLDRDPEARERGFTLIELMIVMIVLGTLGGIVLIAVGTARDDAEGTRARSDAHQCDTAVAAFTARHGTPPDGPGDLAVFFVNGDVPPACP